MTKGPLVNAGLASIYIAALVFGIFFGVAALEPVESVAVPILMLSLFVLSAAVMGYLFLYEPLMFILAGEQRRGVTLFLQTVGIFAAIAAAILCAIIGASLVGQH